MCESNVKCRAGERGREGRLRSCIGRAPGAQWPSQWAPPASSSPVDGALWPSSWLLCSSQVQPLAPQPSPTQPARTATQPLSCCEDKKNLTKFSKDPSSLTSASGRHIWGHFKNILAPYCRALKPRRTSQSCLTWAWGWQLKPLNLLLLLWIFDELIVWKFSILIFTHGYNQRIFKIFFGWRAR